MWEHLETSIPMHSLRHSEEAHNLSKVAIKGILSGDFRDANPHILKWLKPQLAKGACRSEGMFLAMAIGEFWGDQILWRTKYAEAFEAKKHCGTESADWR